MTPEYRYLANIVSSIQNPGYFLTMDDARIYGEWLADRTPPDLHMELSFNTESMGYGAILISDGMARVVRFGGRPFRFQKAWFYLRDCKSPSAAVES